MRRGALACSLAVAATAFAAVPAEGAIILGQTQASLTSCTAPSIVEVQTAIAPGVPSYTVPPGGGVITSWQHRASDIPNAQLKLKVLRSTSDLSGPANFNVVGESGFAAVPQPILYSFRVRIPVLAGDRIGLATAANAAAAPPACGLSTAIPADQVYLGADFSGSATLMPSDTFRLNIAATLEPDADGDGFGDETQDNCFGAIGPNNGCPPTTVPRSASGKKCKKRKKKGRSGAVTARKKCGKKKKR